MLDSHACLKKDQVDQFHKHLNSINQNIQFTLKLENINGQGLPFLDTVTSRRGTEIHVDVYRKPTQFNSIQFLFTLIWLK